MMELCASNPFHLNEILKESVCCRMGLGFATGIMPYGMRWRKHRRIFHENFRINAVYKYQPIQRREIHAFLRRLLDTPDNFLHRIRQ